MLPPSRSHSMRTIVGAFRRLTALLFVRNERSAGPYLTLSTVPTSSSDVARRPTDTNLPCVKKSRTGPDANGTSTGAVEHSARFGDSLNLPGQASRAAFNVQPRPKPATASGNG